MNHITEIMAFIAGMLQFIVAGYALMLNRIFGTSRVGWSLVCAFSLMALLHLLQSAMPFGITIRSDFKIEGVYGLIALLMLTGMVHLETLLKERMRMESLEHRMRLELEAEVKKQTAYLMRAIEELQTEMDERKRMETEVEKANTELFYISSQVKAAQMGANK